jgi:hypothetical protein
VNPNPKKMSSDPQHCHGVSKMQSWPPEEWFIFLYIPVHQLIYLGGTLFLLIFKSYMILNDLSSPSLALFPHSYDKTTMILTTQWNLLKCWKSFFFIRILIKLSCTGNGLDIVITGTATGTCKKIFEGQVMVFPRN